MSLTDDRSVGPRRGGTVDPATRRGGSQATVTPFGVRTRPIVIGVGAGVLTLILRLAGVIVGPLALLVAAACLVFFPGPSRFTDRVLLISAVIIGWLPLLGWVPHVGTTIDVPGIVLSIATAVAVGYQAKSRRERLVTVRVVPAEIAALTLGVAVVLWWGFPFWRMSLTGRFHALFSGYDNLAHFAFFRANLKLGNFVTVTPHYGGQGMRSGWNYPEGIHQAWAQWVRLWNPHPALANNALLNTYSTLLIVTTGLIVVIGALAVVRLCSRDVLIALPAMGIVTGVCALDFLWPFTGFPNFDVAVVAAALAVTLILRPSLGPSANWLAVSGFSLVAAYNWYPLFLIVVPAFLVATMRTWGEYDRHRNLRRISSLVAALLLIAPVFVFIHDGLGVLNASGGVTEPLSSWGLFILLMVGSVIALAIRQSRSPARLTNLVLASPAALGGVGVLLLVAYEVASRNQVSYYAEKLASGVFAVGLIVLSCVIVHDLDRSSLRYRMSLGVRVTVGLLAFIAGFQIDGYAGPYFHALPGSDIAPGLIARQTLARSPRASSEAKDLLAAVQVAQQHGNLGTGPSLRWYYIDPDPNLKYAESAQWFVMLLGNPVDSEFRPIARLAARLDALDFVFFAPYQKPAAQAVLGEFRGVSLNQLHIFVPQWLATAIIAQDAKWARPGLLITLH